MFCCFHCHSERSFMLHSTAWTSKEQVFLFLFMWSRVSVALIHWFAICYPVSMKLLCVSNIAVHALPLRVASMPAVRFDLNGSLLTCLYFIIHQEYNVICIFAKRMQTWYNTCIYLCWINFVWVWVWVWMYFVNVSHFVLFAFANRCFYIAFCLILQCNMPFEANRKWRLCKTIYWNHETNCSTTIFWPAI